MVSTIGIKNKETYITLENGWIIPEYKKDIIQISNDYNEIFIFKGMVEKLIVGIPYFSNNKLRLLPGAIMSFLPETENLKGFEIGVSNDGLLKKVFEDLRVREDLKEKFLNPKFVKDEEQRFYDGLDGEYVIRDIKVSLNSSYQYVGFNLNWNNQ